MSALWSTSYNQERVQTVDLSKITSSDRNAALFRGIEQNRRSIQRLHIKGDDLGESVLSSLSAMLRSKSCCLTTIELEDIRLSDT